MTVEPRRRADLGRPAGPVDWAAVFQAVLVTFGATVVVGALCGFAGGVLGRTMSDVPAEGRLEAVLLHVFGFAVGFIPITLGAVYLSRRVEEPSRHCLILGVLDFTAAAFANVGFYGTPVGGWDVAYLLCIIPAALAIGRWHESM